MAKNRLNAGKEGAFDKSARDICNNNFSDVSLASAQLDLTSVTGTTFTTVPGMVSDALVPGATYKFRLSIPTVCTANNGSKFAFKQGVASLLASIQYNATMSTASGVANTNGTTATDQAALADNASSVVIKVEIDGTFTLNNTQALNDAFKLGTTTLTFQAAEHTSHADTLSVLKGALMSIDRVTTG